MDRTQGLDASIGLGWPPQPDLLLWVALCLLAAGLLGELVWRTLRWPRAIGYVLTGIVATAFGLGIEGMRFDGLSRRITDLALALLLFEAGGHLRLRWLRDNPWLANAGAVESLACFGAVAVVLSAIGVEWPIAWVCAAIAVATAPSVLMQVSAEMRTAGQITDRSIVFAVLSTFVAVLAMEFIAGWKVYDLGGGATRAIGHTSYVLVGSGLLAVVLGAGVRLLARWIDLRDEHASILLIGALLLALALASMARLSTLLVPLLAGIVWRNISPRPGVWPRHFGTLGKVLVLMLFVIAGTSWSLHLLSTAAWAALALIAARFVAKGAAMLALGVPGGLTLRQSAALGLAALPMSGPALVMAAEFHRLAPVMGPRVAAIVFCAVALTEIPGLLAAFASFKWAREIDAR